ncbi:MAG: hypothetical protein LWX07_05125 [Bacteroidetes bacterium]|nr:hypothetical protein [Bacteroidota bacterium]
MKKISLLCLILLLNCKSFTQTNYWANLVYFSGCPVNHIPKGITIPDKDRTCREIINAIISGATDTVLNEQFHDSLSGKIYKLLNGGVIKRSAGRYAVTFPVLTGEDRIKLKSVIHAGINEIYPRVDSMITPLKKILGVRSGMTFHFLWSRVIDDCWWDLYNSEFKTREGPPSIAFIVSPPHPLQCGTNFDNTKDDGQIAISWSYNLFDDFFSLPPTSSFYSLAMNMPLPEKDKEFFLTYGLLDSSNKAKIFTYKEDGKLDKLCGDLKKTYVRIINGIFNYKKLSSEFHIPADELFVVMSHEIAYEIFELIGKKNTELYIPILLEKNPGLSFENLVSIRLPDK